MKKYFLLSTTEGCATHLLENSGYRKYYEGLGYVPASSPPEADVILINTCGYSGAMEDRAIRTIRECRERYVGKEVVLAGCLPRINPAGVKAVFDGAILEPRGKMIEFAQSHHFDTEDFSRLSYNHRFILALRRPYFAVERFLGVEFQPLHNIFKSVVVNEKYFLVTVSTGCLGKCTFCAIKRAKGGLRSRPLEVLVSEIKSGLKSGYTNFWLLGDDIGCWGQDRGSNLTALLEAILGLPQRFSLVLNYLDPHYLGRYGERLTELLGDSRIEGVNLPIQSGSQRMLKEMGRDYDLKVVFAILAAIKRRNPALAVKSNIMIGFPGESWGDFWKSLLAIRHYDANLAIKFAPRPHTPAEKFGGQIPEPVKAVRLFLINTCIFVWHCQVAIRSLFRISRAETARATGVPESVS